MIQKYGTIIKEERLRHHMQRDVLANILLLPDETMEAAENGYVELSECRLNICANIFGLSKDALMLGVRRPALSDDEILRQFNELKKQIDDLSNIKEKSFGEQVDEVLNGTYSRYDDLKIGDTPKVLLAVGCKQLPILYTQRHLRMAIKPKDREVHTHGISIEQIKDIYSSIESPAIVYDSLTRKDSLVIVSAELDMDNNPIVISIRPNGQGRYEAAIITSNFATSIYGKENIGKHLENVINSGNVLYVDKKKSQALFSVLGLEFPKGLNNFDSNSIIRKSSHIVKEITPEKRRDATEFDESMEANATFKPQHLKGM